MKKTLVLVVSLWEVDNAVVEVVVVAAVGAADDDVGADAGEVVEVAEV